MSILEKMNISTSIIKNIVIIGGICLVAAFMSLSVVANFTEDKPAGTGLPKSPSVEKAQYEIKVKTTGQVLYTNNYEHPSDAVYLLHRFYAVDGKKYKLFKTDLLMNERYFGPITITKRKE
jgi:hypothetical protein